MGFGIRLPGIRVSTRGVRVGPRIANVRVGRGGAGISVGPRIARVSAGTSGIRVGSGIGPIHVSNRGVGVGLGGRLGGIGVSNRGINAVVSPGPFWLSGRLPSSSRRGSNKSSTGNQVSRATSRLAPAVNVKNVFRSTEPHLGAQFKQYKKQLADAGVQRRNRFDVRVAATQAILWNCASLAALMRSFSPITSPKVPPLPTDAEIRRAAKSSLKSRGELRLFTRGKATIIDDEAKQLSVELKHERKEAISRANRSYAKFKNLDPVVTGVVFDAILSDNMYPARWIGAIDSVGVVLVSLGDVEASIWPEEQTVSKSGKLQIKLRSKTETIELHKEVLLRAILATAKEVLVAHDGLSEVWIIVVNRSSKTPLLQRRVWGHTVVKRDELKQLRSSDGAIAKVAEYENSWYSNDCFVGDDDEYSFFTGLIAAELKLSNSSRDVLRFFSKRVRGKDDPKSGALLDSGSIEEVFADEHRLLDLMKAARISGATSGPTPDCVHDVDFWLGLSS